VHVHCYSYTEWGEETALTSTTRYWGETNSAVNLHAAESQTCHILPLVKTVLASNIAKKYCVFHISFWHALFGTNYCITFYYEQKLLWYVSTFFMYSETKIQLDPTKNANFPSKNPTKISLILNMTLPKVGDIYHGGYGGNVTCRVQLKVGFRVHKTRWHISCKFQHEIRRYVECRKRYRQKAYDKLIWNAQ